MTSSDGGIGSTTDGNAFAAFLLGYPSSRTDRESRLSVSTPLNVFTNYFGGYAQDDWRISSRFTLNYGLRLEHENGLERDATTTSRVGFDPAMTSALSSIDDSRRSGRRDAGADGRRRADVRRAWTATRPTRATRRQSSGRRGSVRSTRSTTATVIRGGYGLYWAPFNYPVPSTAESNYGQVGFSQNTILDQQPQQPDDARESVPERHRAAVGQHSWRAHQPRQQHQLRRSTPDGAARSAVLGRPAARAAGRLALWRATWARAAITSGLGGSQRHRDQHQPAGSEVPGARIGRARCAAAKSVPWKPERPALAVDADDAVARAAAAAVPAVRAGQRPAGH